MITDVLHDAIPQIQAYLDRNFHPGSEYVEEIKILMRVIDMVRTRCDSVQPNGTTFVPETPLVTAWFRKALQEWEEETEAVIRVLHARGERKEGNRDPDR